MEMMENAWQSRDPLGKDIAANVAQLVEVINPNFLPYQDGLSELGVHIVTTWPHFV